MRVAVFSDIHGNSIALDAVLADIERVGGVDAHWFVGDAVALGFDPVGTIRTLEGLPGLTAVRGNTDRDTVRDAEGSDADFVTLPDGTRVLLVHAAPGTDDGPGIRGEQSEEELSGTLASADADLVIVGHTHKPLDRTAAGARAWNLGSVSVPFTAEKRAMWTLLEAGDRGYRLERHYDVYDVARMLSRLEAIHHPAEASIRAFWAGK